jgi:hypothetical protein
MSISGKIATRSGEELEATVKMHEATDKARIERERLRKEGAKTQTATRKVRGENKFQRPVIIAPPARHYARRDDAIRNALEAQQEQIQKERVVMERATRPPREVAIQTEARQRGRPRTRSERVYSLNTGRSSRSREDRGGSLSGGVANLTSLGSLPEYTPPNFALKGSGYKPLDYKPISDAPMFKPTGFKTMDYKPMSAGSYYKPGEYKTIGNEPYYRPSQYQPIGQFGSVINNPPNISGLQRSEIAEPKKRKKKKKTKEPRLIGE